MLHLNMGDQIRNHELRLDYSHGRIIYIYIPVGGFNFQPLWKILVNGTDYPIYYGK